MAVRELQAMDASAMPDPVSVLALLSARPTQTEPTIATLTAARRAMPDPSKRPNSVQSSSMRGRSVYVRRPRQGRNVHLVNRGKNLHGEDEPGEVPKIMCEKQHQTHNHDDVIGRNSAKRNCVDLYRSQSDENDNDNDNGGDGDGDGDGDDGNHNDSNDGDRDDHDDDENNVIIDDGDSQAEQRAILAQNLPVRAAAYAVEALKTHATDVRVAHHAVSLLAHPALAAKFLAPEEDTLAATLSSALPRRLSQSFRRDFKHHISGTPTKARSFAYPQLPSSSQQQQQQQHQNKKDLQCNEYRQRQHEAKSDLEGHDRGDLRDSLSSPRDPTLDCQRSATDGCGRFADVDRRGAQGSSLLACGEVSGSVSAIVARSALGPSPMLRPATSLATSSGGDGAAVGGSDSASFSLSPTMPRESPAAVANSIEGAVCESMGNFPFSSAFQHTALAALQNAARADRGDAKQRETVLTATIGVMRKHPSHCAILLRGVDLLAFHLNQIAGVPSPQIYRAATDMVVSSSRKLATTAQGAGAVLLACVAAARWSASAAGLGPPLGLSAASTGPVGSSIAPNVIASRLSRVGNSSFAPSSLIDPLFCACVVSCMRKHLAVPHVQILGCETVRVAGRLAGRDLMSSGAIEAILSTLEIHSTNIAVIDRAVPALRAVLLDASSPRPSLALSSFASVSASPLGLGGPVDVCNRVITAAEVCANSASHLSPDTCAVAKVLAVDIRNAVIADAKKLGSLDQAGRRDRFGLRRFVKLWYRKSTPPEPASADFIGQSGRKKTSPGRVSSKSSRPSHDVHSYASESSSERPRRGRDMHTSPGRVSLPAASYGGRTSLDANINDPYLFDGVDQMYDGTEESQQIRANRRFRSVGGLFATRRRMSRASISHEPYIARPSRERWNPLALSNNEVDKLARQPSNAYLFGATAF